MFIRAGFFSTFFMIAGCSELSTLSTISTISNTLAAANVAGNFHEDDCYDVSDINSQELLPYLKSNNYPLVVTGNKKFVCTCAGADSSGASVNGVGAYGVGRHNRGSEDNLISEDRWGELVGRQESIYLAGLTENYKIQGMSENEFLFGEAERSDIVGIGESEALISGGYEMAYIAGLDESVNLLGSNEVTTIEGDSEIFKNENDAYSCRTVSNCAGFQLTGFGVDYVTLLTESGSRKSSTSCVII